MNGPIRKVSVAAMVMFAALLVNSSVSYIAFSDSLENNQLNRRVMDARYAEQRGPIMVGNTPIVRSEKVKDRFKFQRIYLDGPIFAPITGYYSYYYGASALEHNQSAQLSGQDTSQFLDSVIRQISGSQPEGSAVETTINSQAQKTAWKGLAGRKGAVVALDTSTGAIRALVTSPSYDPNLLATHDLDESKVAWEKLNADPAKPMTNRATREIYPPGSTFKLITAAAALEDGLTPETAIDASAFHLPNSSRVIEGNCGGKEVSLAHALLVSCNPGFARLGVELGAEKIAEQAAKFGFGTPPLSDIGSVSSRFPDDIDPAQTAMSAIGEFEVAATPLQMAMVAATIQNGGLVMKPYLVESIRTADLKPIYEAIPNERGQAVSSETANGLREMMIDVVKNGTGRRAQVSGLEIGGKTGTAVTDRVRNPYAWFVAFASEINIAVCVFVEDAEISADEIAGARVAAPVAKAVIEALR